jgi:hypothetical protein
LCCQQCAQHASTVHGKCRNHVEGHKQDVNHEELGQQSPAGGVHQAKLPHGNDSADDNEDRNGDKNIHGRPGNCDNELLLRIGWHSFQASDSADWQQRDIWRSDAESPRREGVAKFVEQHAQKDQEGKDHPVDCCLWAAVDVIDPGIKCKQQEEGQVNPHLNARDGCYSVGPFHLRTMADGPLQASAFRRRALRGSTF